MAGRTHPKYLRCYVGGYDLSGETRSIGPLSWDYGYTEDSALTWEVQGGLCERATISTGQVNTIFRFDTTAATSPHDWLNGMNGNLRGVTVPFGSRTAPVAGDPTWMAVHRVKNVNTTPPDSGLVTATMDFSPSFYGNDVTPTLINFDVPWGILLHANSAATGANTAVGIDRGGATTAGGWMLCQFLSYAGAGSATVTVQDAAVNNDAGFAAVAGLTTGAIAHTAMPGAVYAQTTNTATIRQYVRWQIALVGLTSCTFVLSFARGK